MRFYGEGLKRRRISIVLWITVFWTAAAALDALNTHAISGTALLARTGAYNFPLFFTVNTLTAAASSLLSGSLLMFVLRDQVRSRSFGFAIMINSFLIALLNVFFSAVGLAVYLSYQLGVPCWSETVELTTVELLRTGLCRCRSTGGGGGVRRFHARLDGSGLPGLQRGAGRARLEPPAGDLRHRAQLRIRRSRKAISR